MMEAKQAKKVLQKYRSIVKYRDVYEAIDTALRALTWQIIYEKQHPEVKELPNMSNEQSL